MGKDEALMCNSTQVKGQSAQQSPGSQEYVPTSNKLDLYPGLSCFIGRPGYVVTNKSPITVIVMIPCVLYCLQGWLLHEVYHKWC